MSRARKNSSRPLIFAASCGAICAAAIFTVYRAAMPGAPVAASVQSREDLMTGTVLLPDGEGNCNKYLFGNDTGKSTYAGTVACKPNASGDARANLPPALRGMQDSLRSR